MTSEVDILMVEDDREQAELIIDTARVCRSTISWEVAQDGATALARLADGARGRPALVLLDLHLPGLDGIEVLRAIKAEPRLRGLPVIVASSSRDSADVDAVYALGANCYVAKPGSFEGLCSLVRFLEAFLTLPRSETPATPAPPVPGSPIRTLN